MRHGSNRAVTRRASRALFGAVVRLACSHETNVREGVFASAAEAAFDWPEATARLKSCPDEMLFTRFIEDKPLTEFVQGKEMQ